LFVNPPGLFMKSNQTVNSLVSIPRFSFPARAISLSVTFASCTGRTRCSRRSGSSTNYAHFFDRQLAIAVFVQLAERGRRAFQFISIQRTVLVGIQRRHQRSARSSTGTAFRPFSARTLPGAFFILIPRPAIAAIALSSFPSGTTPLRAPKLGHRQLPIAILIELLQRFRRAGNFGLVQLSIVIRVQRSKNSRHRSICARAAPFAIRSLRFGILRL
jgi:hypothetical protein